MSLVKWLRKNNTKVMAVVVIVLMFVFVGGTALERLLMGGRSQLDEVIAYFANDRKITNYDRAMARQDLEILRMLQADTMLRGSTELVFRTLDLKRLLLGELLFSESTTSPALVANLRQLIRRNEYRITAEQIDDIYRPHLPGEIYWLLLSAEAERAGIRISNEEARATLANMYSNNPDVFGGATYARLIGTIVERRGIPEEKILNTFARLTAVTQYAGLVCSSENLTARQIRFDISSAGETIDVDFVRFDSSVFAEQQPEPNESHTDAHFEKYRDSFPGILSDEDPYGFGYKLPAMARLGYLALKLDDVSQTLDKPTQQEVEQYYQKNRSQFVEQVPDPNNPNGPMVDRTKSYAEVAGDISNMLIRQKTNARAELILDEAKTLTEAVLENAGDEPKSIRSEQLRETGNDYRTAAEQLTKKYNVTLYVGQTGLLSADEMRADPCLGRLYIRAYGLNMVRLPRTVFAIDELGTSQLGPFDVPKPKMYENIGPVRDAAEMMMAIVRVTQAEKPAEPKSLDQTISKVGMEFDNSEGPEDANAVYSVAEHAVGDLKRLTAMDTARSKADEFKVLVANQGWDEAINQFNRRYGDTEPNQPDANAIADEGITDQARKPFRLQKMTGLSRISRMGVETFEAIEAGSPDASFDTYAVKKEAVLRDRLYALVPKDTNSLDSVPYVLEFKPDLSYYCLKSLVINRISRIDYEMAKARQSYRIGFVGSQSLYAVHYNPENILQRMKFKPVEPDSQPTDANTPKKTEGAS